jgi:outer membrane protein assembly factor BamB
VAGTTYQIAVGGKDGGTGALSLTLGYQPPNDQFSNATPLTGASMRVAGFNTVAGGDEGEPLAASNARGRTVWYKWTAPFTDYVAVSVFAFGFDAVGAVYTAANNGALNLVDRLSTELYNDAAVWEAITGTTYYIQIDSTTDATGFFNLAVIDGFALPAAQAVHPSAAIDPTSDQLVIADTYGLMFVLPETGAVQSFELDGTLETQSPAIAGDGSIYIGDEFGWLYCLNPNLTVRWKKNLGSVQITCSPAVGADSAVYVHTDDGFLHAYFPDGTLKWKAVIPGESYSSPSIGVDGTLYIGSEDEHLYALNPVDGSVRWKFKADERIYASAAIDFQGHLYFGTLGGKFYSVSSAGEQRWVYDTGAPISSSAAIGSDGSLYFGSYDGHLYALSAVGTLRWRYLTGDEIRASSPAIAGDGSIYIGSYDGYLHSVSQFGVLKRLYATGDYIRSSPLIHEGYLYFGSGDSREYVIWIGLHQAVTPWPMHRQNIRRTGRRAPTLPPTIQVHPESRTVAAGASTTLTSNAQGDDPLTFQWHFNGNPIPGATQSAYTIANAAVGNAGNYSVVVTNHLGHATSQSAAVGVTSSVKLTGPGQEFPNILHNGTGFTYDQILLGGSSASVRADPGQILRISFVDLNDDIVQVEFSGAGTLTLSLESSSGPGLPVNYQQNTSYMKGHAGITLAGADATSNLSVFSVGRANAVNQALFKDDATYDGFADIAYIAITSTDGKFGGLRTANASYFATKGITGLNAPGVEFTGPVFVGDIRAVEEATPVIIIGSGGDTRITGGDLLQTNGRAVQVSGLARLQFAAGSNSHGTLFNAQNNRARLEQAGTGIDVTSAVVANPGP